MTLFYHGTRTDLAPDDLIEAGPDHPVRLTPDLDEAIWDAELDDAEDPPRVYVVEPTGPAEDVSHERPPGPPSMSWRCGAPLRVLSEVTEWPLYHGTRADLAPGDLIEPGYGSNFGDRTANHVYAARTLDAAMWGAELAVGDGPGRIYRVEPTGSMEDDPNLTDKKFRGNPTKSFRSREPLRVTGEVTDWPGHSPEAIQAMKDGLERLKKLGLDVVDD